jgi:hypothetical protein
MFFSKFQLGTKKVDRRLPRLRLRTANRGRNSVHAGKLFVKFWLDLMKYGVMCLKKSSRKHWLHQVIIGFHFYHWLDISASRYLKVGFQDGHRLLIVLVN